MAFVVWRTLARKLEILKRSDAARFEVWPKRRIVKRTFAWISRNRLVIFERYARNRRWGRSPRYDAILLGRLAAYFSPSFLGALI